MRLGLRDIPTRVNDLYSPNSSNFSIDLDSSVVLNVDDVYFSYPESTEPTLNGVSLTFERGKRYAIVGPSGSGKTTLLDICMGILKPSSGSVTWNLKSTDSIGYVPQDSHIAATGLQENVALEWDPKILRPDQFTAAMLRASLNDLIPGATTPTTPILSGGQRQRIGLARALYRQSNVLFLDEPTSALDASTEADVMDSLLRVDKRMTLIIVTHRLSTIQNVDEVIYIDHGCVLGQGPFSILQRLLPQFEHQVELSTIKPPL